VYRVNLRDLYNSVNDRLEAAGIPEPRLESQLLLRHAFSLTKSDFYSRLYDEDFDQAALANLEIIVQQRTTRKPLAYIVQVAEFFGREFSVNSSVLIPRQETEVLIEHCIEVLRASSIEKPLVSDIGTGSGIIAITLAAEIPALQVIAVDRSIEASSMASNNSMTIGTTNSVHCITGDLLTSLKCQFDLIAANLPYISTLSIATLQPEISIYEPKIALDGGHNGLILIERLLDQSRTRIKQGGYIVLEIDPPLAPAVLDLAQRYFPTCNATLLNDLNGDIRIVSVQV
jgi:release factor glutamine methyltransferase